MNETLLLWINQDWAHPWLDLLFSWVSSRPAFALPLATGLLYLSHRNWGRRGLALWGFLVLTVAVGDFIGSLLKDLMAAARPCFSIPDLVRIPGRPAGSHCGPALTGWPSNHTLNFFTVAAFLTVMTRSVSWSVSLYLIAVLVGISRIYLGKHFPDQVAAGALIGLSWGFLVAGLLTQVWQLSPYSKTNKITTQQARSDDRN